MTKQELQQKIYEAGFKPPKMSLLHEEGVGFHPQQIPHYPCEWLWARLPCAIRGSDECWYYLKLGRYWGVYAREGRDSDSLVEVPTEKDLHQALLELFVWCIDNGHIKND